MYFFSRFGKVKPMTKKGGDYKPGEIVAWKLVGGQTHIGLVINRLSGDRQRYMVVHNIGYGQEVSDCLFDFEVIGHYYYDKINYKMTNVEYQTVRYSTLVNRIIQH
jgi:uncharacterized protein YijF (DUF1287 family)